MRASTACKMSRSVPAAMIASWIAVGLPTPACANVITDWDEKAVAVVSPIVAAGVTQSIGLRGSAHDGDGPRGDV